MATEYKYEGAKLTTSNGTKVSFGPNYPEGDPDNYDPEMAYIAWCRWGFDGEWGFQVSSAEVEEMKKMTPDELQAFIKDRL